MKNYFEDNMAVPCLKAADVRVCLDTPEWKVHPTTDKLTRQHFSLPYWEDALDAYQPSLLTLYRVKGQSYIFNDYGNLVVPVNENGYTLPLASPTSIMESSDPLEAMLTVDDFGDVWLLDEDEDKQYWYLCSLDKWGGADTNTNDLEQPPGMWTIYRNRVVLQKEQGWDILHHHATMNGMLAVRWLGLYGDVEDIQSSKSWGFNSEPSNHWYDRSNVRTRKFARKIFEHEVFPTREVAAEVFPMEVGSLLARWKYLMEGKTLVGLVIDPVVSDLRRIYAEDCWSRNDNGTLVTERRDYLKHWEGWHNSRIAYESLPPFKRLRRTYTEGFIRNSSPCAMVVYGREDALDTYQISWVQKFKKNGYPIYWLAVSTATEN